MFIKNLFCGLAIAGLSFITACGQTGPFVDEGKEAEPIHAPPSIDLSEEDLNMEEEELVECIHIPIAEEIKLLPVMRSRSQKEKEKGINYHMPEYTVWQPDPKYDFKSNDEAWLLFEFKSPYPEFDFGIQKVRVRYSPRNVQIHSKTPHLTEINTLDLVTHFYPNSENQVLIPLTIIDQHEFNISVRFINGLGHQSIYDTFDFLQSE